MRAFLKLNLGMLRMPVYVRLWLIPLVAANMIIPLFFLGHLEAQVVLSATVASLMLMTVLTGISGFYSTSRSGSRLLGPTALVLVDAARPDSQRHLLRSLAAYPDDAERAVIGG